MLKKQEKISQKTKADNVLLKTVALRKKNINCRLYKHSKHKYFAILF